MGIFHRTPLYLIYRQIGRNPLDFKTTAFQCRSKKIFKEQNKTETEKKELNDKYFKVISSKYTNHIRNKTPILFYPVFFLKNMYTCNSYKY